MGLHSCEKEADMITLDYRTDNPRWGLSGVAYKSWESFAFVLGYLANEAHYRNTNGGLVDLHVESNDAQGAWGKEGRIHYYGSGSYLSSKFADWDRAKSAGNGSITCRINSNDYLYSLVHDFGFEVKKYRGYTTADIFPPSTDAANHVWNVLKIHLGNIGLNASEIADVFQYYKDGWNE